MNVLRFVNSRAVREHLEKIDYRFSGFEAVWLIWNCRHATRAEKIMAWREILSSRPD